LFGDVKDWLICGSQSQSTNVACLCGTNSFISIVGWYRLVFNVGIDIQSPRENEMLVSSIWLFSLSDGVFFGSRKHQSSNRLVLTSFRFVNEFSTELMAEKFLCPIGTGQRSKKFIAIARSKVVYKQTNNKLGKTPKKVPLL
jgi:hypothetical protein